MKKIIGAVAALAAVAVVAAPAQAKVENPNLTWTVSDIQANPAFYNTVVVQQITDYEQTVLDNLNQGVTINTNAQQFVFAANSGNVTNNQVASAWNQTVAYLTTNAYSDAQINQLNNIINQGRALIINNVDKAELERTASLTASLPIGTQSTLLDLAAQAQTILAGGSDVLQKGTTLTEKEAQKYCDAKDGKPAANSSTTGVAKTAATGSVVKTTGADYTANLAVFAGLVVASVGVAFVGKKYSTKIGLF